MVCKPVVSRQSVISPDLVIHFSIDNINIGIFPAMKNQSYEYIILNSKPNTIYLFNVTDSKMGLYGHSSFPQINNKKYYEELKMQKNNINNIKMVKYAGRLTFDTSGKLKSWNNSSGHFKPSANNSHIVGLEMSKFEKHGQVMTWAKIASRRK